MLNHSQYPSQCIKPLAVIALIFSLSGCASRVQLPKLAEHPADTIQECFTLLKTLREHAELKNLQDAQTVPVSEYPQFRVNRVLASFDLHALNQRQLQRWGELAKREAITGFETELKRLNSPEHRRNNAFECINKLPSLAPNDLKMPKLSAYDHSVRKTNLHKLVDGLLLTSIHREQKTMYKHFGGSSHYIIPKIRYTTAPPITIKKSHRLKVNEIQTDVLGLPAPTFIQLSQFAKQHAPEIDLEHMDKNDQIIPEHAPEIHWLHSYTKINDQWHLQIIYHWFYPARETNDLYSGWLDGLIWRVTLDSQYKNALVYDSIHPCGCYHRVFIPEKSHLKLKAINQKKENPLFHRIDVPLNKRLRIRIDQGEHYIGNVQNLNNLDPIPPVRKHYKLIPYKKLRQSLQDNGKPFFNGQGIVDGSQRLERFILWQHGIKSPGAMRQWGVHAINFINQRHFDDVELFDLWLEKKP